MSRGAESRTLLATAGWLVLVAAVTRSWLESSMVLHMLVQLPLLAIAGWYLGKAWRTAEPAGIAGRSLGVLQSCNAGGVTGLVTASFVMLVWMLPRSLDTARLDGAADALKFLTVPCAGLVVALSWPRLPVIARAVVHLEVIATFVRFGWGYLAADQRLCLAYLADDQRRAGELLIWLGAAYAIAVCWRPMFGAAPRWPLRLPRRGVVARPNIEDDSRRRDFL